MQAAGVRTLPEDDQQAARQAQGLSLVEPADREAVLLQWEQKIEQSERSSRRFDRDAAPEEAAIAIAASQQRVEPVDAPRPGRFERLASAAVVTAVPVAAVAERRTITITGHPTPARRRQTLTERHIVAQPDRIALWAFLLGLLLIAVAAGTAHA
jgi:hypothetical protein